MSRRHVSLSTERHVVYGGRVVLLSPSWAGKPEDVLAAIRNFIAALDAQGFEPLPARPSAPANPPGRDAASRDSFRSISAHGATDVGTACGFFG